LSDFVVNQELRAGSEISDTADAIIKAGEPDTAKCFSAWRLAVTGAYPSRAAMRAMLQSFGRLLQLTRRSQRPVFLDFLPRIAPCVDDLEVAGIEEILKMVNAFEDSGDGQHFLEFVGLYGSTSGQVVLGVARIAHKAIRYDRKDYLSKFLAIVPPERTLENADAKKLIPTLASLIEVSSPRGKDFCCKGLDLFLTVAGKNYSSACFSMREVPKRLESVSSSAGLYYVEDFERLVQAIGISVVGFCLNKLPKMYGEYGVAATRSFVEAAASAADTYGINAGQGFLERMTGAARKMLIR
jgi:hypothetical protein